MSAPRSPRSAATATRVLALVPARLASQRLPGKMLLVETGRPLVVHSAENLARMGLFARVVIATDSTVILEAARAHGCEALLTRVDHQSGTDRIAEAWNALAELGETADVVVNVQGDEPELEREDLARLVAEFVDQSVEIATLAAPIGDPEQFAAHSVVKVVRRSNGDALYFSRAPIPALGHARGDAADEDLVRRHVGVYAFRPAALQRCVALPPSRLEQRESLEQLRWLEAGLAVRVTLAASAPHGIDTRADYERFVARQQRATARDSAAHDDQGTNTQRSLFERSNAAPPNERQDPIKARAG